MDRYKEIARLRESAHFLGYEFLTWLFLLLDRDDSDAEIAKLANTKIGTGVVLGNRVVTCLFHHKEQKTTIASPILQESHEIFASFKNGHVVESLSINVVFDETVMNLTLHAQDFAFTQIKLNNSFDNTREDLTEDDQMREDMFLRMTALSDAEALMDSCFRAFLTLRVNGYKSVQKSMREHVENRLSSYLSRGTVKDAPASHAY